MRSIALFSIVFCCLSVSQVCAQNEQATQPKIEISDEALRIHHAGMLFDGHNDLPWAMRRYGGSFEQMDISKPTQFHTDIDRLKKGGLKAQFWSVYVPAGTDLTGNALYQTLEQIQVVHDMCKAYPDVFEMADTAADIKRITEAGKIASMIGVEGGHSIENSLQVLRELYRRGARYMTLTHSKTLAWADSATDDAKNNGLSPFGKEVVREMNRIGMLVDLSHVSEKCMKDALETTQAPVIFSHSSARAICDHPRNVSDEVLKLTAQNGGVVMINFMSGYIVPTEKLKANERELGTYKDVCDHIDHVVKVAGIDHVGIGSDYDGVSRLPLGLHDVSCYPSLTQELLNRGYNETQLHKLLGGNVLRVLEAAEKVAKSISEKKREADNDSLFRVKLAVGDRMVNNEIVQVLVDANGFSGDAVTLSDAKGNTYLAQLAAPGLKWRDSKERQGKRELTFVLKSAEPDSELELTARAAGLNQYQTFSWHDDNYGTSELRFNGRGGDQSVMSYQYTPLDEATPERRGETYKVFHHVYSPRGDRLLTKGPGGLFPHHRGLFYGFNRISYGGKSADVWHCNKGESQTHEKMITQVGGPVFGRQVALVYWRGQDGEPFAHEFREMTAYKVAGSTLIEFNSSLNSTVGKLRLDGDPQHAGFQFRASQVVPDATKAKTFYIRPDGVGSPGKFRNWSAKSDETQKNLEHINLPWNALCIEVPKVDTNTNADGRSRSAAADQFTITYLDNPGNPKPARFSERDYGRFGSYFEHELDNDRPLHLNYRIWIDENITKEEKIRSRSRGFVKPIQLK